MDIDDLLGVNLVCITAYDRGRQALKTNQAYTGPNSVQDARLDGIFQK
jgi:hypothetical protein